MRSTCSARCGCSSAPAPPRSSSRIRPFPSAAAISPTRAWSRSREMVGKIHAAVDARRSEETLDHRPHRRRRRRRLRRRGRTRAGLRRGGRRRAVRRGAAHARSARRGREGARRSRAADGQHGRGRPRRRSSPGRNSRRSASALVIFPGAIVRALAHAAQDFYAVLKRDGTTDAFRDRMFDFDALNAIVGTPEMLARGKRYEDGDRPDERARSRHARHPQGPAGADRRRDGRDALPLRVQSDHRRGARRLPRALSRADRRDAGAGHDRPADLRRRHGLRGQGGDRQGRARGRPGRRATRSSSTTPTTAARISTISGWCGRCSARRTVLLARLGRPLARHRRQRAGRLQRARDRELSGGRAHSRRSS